MNKEQLHEKLLDVINKISSESDKEEIDQERHTQIKDIDIEILRKKEEVDALTVANNLRREELENRKQDRAQRKVYADNIFAFLSVYMAVVMILLWKCASQYNSFYLSDSVIIALITTTTANVIGIFVFVVKYLFKNTEDKAIT